MRKKLKSNKWVWIFLLFIAIVGCNKDNKKASLYTCPMPEDSVFSDKPGTCPKCGMDLVKMVKQESVSKAEMEGKTVYTCPMPEDSVFSDKPGSCPKCGMDLIKMETNHTGHHHEEMIMDSSTPKVFTCPMHPQIIRDKPGQCPICGMDLVEKVNNQNTGKSGLGTLVESVDHTVVATIATVKPMEMKMPLTVKALGYITYNPQNTQSISTRYAGRIEKLYVKYNFQTITKGQKLMEIYSPEIITAQENLLYLLKSDSDNTDALNGARQQLQLLGMNAKQINSIEKTHQSQYLVAIYAPVSGHVHEMNNISDLAMPVMQRQGDPQKMDRASQPNGFSIREGMYLEKGQNVFSVIQTEQLWAILKIHEEDVLKVKLNQPVQIYSEMQPKTIYKDKIEFIEPAFEQDSKYLNVRVYLDLIDHHQLTIGSLIKATIDAGYKTGLWIPKTSVLSLGNNDFVVFLKSGNVFTSHRITVGIKLEEEVEVKEGLSIEDEIALNAQYLIDSEGFVAENR